MISTAVTRSMQARILTEMNASCIYPNTTVQQMTRNTTPKKHQPLEDEEYYELLVHRVMSLNIEVRCSRRSTNGDWSEQLVVQAVMRIGRALQKTSSRSQT